MTEHQKKEGHPAPATCDMCGGTGMYGPDAVNCPCGITPAPAPHLVGADHVDKAEAWDAAQASFQKGYKKGKAEALAAAGSLDHKAILVAVQNFEDETGGFGESENEKIIRGVISAYLSALTTEGQP